LTLPAYLENAAQMRRLERARQKSQVQQLRRMTERDYEFRGNNAAIQTMTDSEILLVGAAGTGKTLGVLTYINGKMWDYPGARALIVRKVRADLAQSTLVTFERDILGSDNPICAGVRRENRMSYQYPNGSEVVVGGMDRPGKVLSAEYDLIYPAEAVQFEFDDWQAFGERNRNFVMPYQQIIGDTNPGPPDHWLKKRCDAGVTKLLNTYHKDNPRYWDGEKWTPQGELYVLGKLAKLSGVRRARYYEGLWAQAEGVIYDEWRDDVHVIDQMPDGWEQWTKFRAADFGYTNPFTCCWFAVDPDGRMYLYREIYHTRRLVEDHAKQIRELSAGEQIAFTVADHDAEDRATLHRHGVQTIAAKKSVSVGIQAVQSRIKIQGDGKPRLFILRSALVEVDEDLLDAKKPTCTREEIAAYSWKDKSKKEEPVKEDDHGMDTMRYAVMAIDTPREVKQSKNPFYGG
jgi:PBSX family phage terminase large subunit